MCGVFVSFCFNEAERHRYVLHELIELHHQYESLASLLMMLFFSFLLCVHLLSRRETGDL